VDGADSKASNQSSCCQHLGEHLEDLQITVDLCDVLSDDLKLDQALRDALITKKLEGDRAIQRVESWISVTISTNVVEMSQGSD